MVPHLHYYYPFALDVAERDLEIPNRFGAISAWWPQSRNLGWFVSGSSLALSVSTWYTQALFEATGSARL
jgi:hypothetical protein